MSLSDAALRRQKLSESLLDAYNDARHRMHGGHLSEAVDLYERLLSLRPDWEHGLPYYNLAQCHEELGDTENARQAYVLALQQDRGSLVFQGGYASFLYLHGEPQDAYREHLRLLEMERAYNLVGEMEKTAIGLRALGERLDRPAAAVERDIQAGPAGDERDR